MAQGNHWGAVARDVKAYIEGALSDQARICKKEVGMGFGEQHSIEYWQAWGAWVALMNVQSLFTGIEREQREKYGEVLPV